MIKNQIQLRRAHERLSEIGREIQEYQNRYSGVELELYVLPLMDMEDELKEEINEFKSLCRLPFEEAISGPLNKPVLIYNIGELLAKIRIAAKLNQKQLAERLAWDQPNLSRFESENYSSQTISKIVEYASSLGIWLYVQPSITEKTFSEKPTEIEFRKAEPKYSDVTSTSGSYSPLSGKEGSDLPKVSELLQQVDTI